MILTCPECTTLYAVDATAIGANGRKVRCSRCCYSWVQTQPQNSPPIQLSATPTPRLNAGNRARPLGKTPPALLPEKKSKGPIVLWALVILMLFGMITSVVWKRDTIMKRFPASVPLLDLFNFVRPSGDGFEIEQQRQRSTIRDGKTLVSIEGKIVEILRKAEPVPKMLGINRNKNGQEVKRWIFNPPLPKLLDGERVTLAPELVEPLNSSAQIIITFDQKK